MKLKGKLISNFATVVLITLIIFGGISYKTIEESSRKNLDQIVRLHSSLIILKLEQVVNEISSQLLYHLPQQKFQIHANMVQDEDSAKEIQKHVRDSSLFKNLFFYNRSSREFIALLDFGKKNQDLSTIPLFEEQKSGKFFWLDGHDLYLFVPLEENNERYFVCEIEKDALVQFAAAQLEIDNSILFITRDNGFLIPPVHKSSENSIDYEEIQLPEFSMGQQFADIKKKGRFYRSPQNLFGAHLTYFVPSSFYYSSLISLKNRIIAALLIISWCSVWVILILAHKITSPISRLSKLTKDIIGFNYSNKLEFTPSKDEIGDLAKNFETMRKKLKGYVTKDQLTNVYNRRFLMHMFEISVQKAQRLQEDLACIIFDVDYFKKVNDNFGHQVGDYVLKEMGKVLLEHMRNYDTPARYGGEEFILVLPETCLEEAFDIAERIRLAVQNLSINYDGREIKCTISLGVSCFDPHTASTSEIIIQNADTALYQAKEKGRNRTVVFKNT